MKESIAHLIELRQRLIRYLSVMGVVFAVFAFFSKSIYHLLTLPLLGHVAGGVGLIAISVPAPFLVPLKSALFLSIFVTVPYLFYQVWAFIAPALYQRERKLLWALLGSSSVLFYGGVAFAYFLVLPWVLQFFVAMAPVGVTVKPGMSEYFSFSVRLFFAFGFSFELPVLIVLLDAMGIYSAERLAEKRPYVVIAAFVVGMLLTPPDVLSQILLAVPLCVLFELGLFFAKRRRRTLESPG